MKLRRNKMSDDVEQTTPEEEPEPRSPDMVLRMGGGFDGDALYARMSPKIARRLAEADERYERQRAHQEAVREQRVAVMRERAMATPPVLRQ